MREFTRHPLLSRRRSSYARTLLCYIVAVIVLQLLFTLLVPQHHSTATCSAASGNTDFEAWRNTRFTSEQVAALLAATNHRCNGRFLRDSGLSLVRIEHGKAGEVVAGWGKDYHRWTYLAERALSRLSGNRLGRPDALKALTDYSGYDTLGKPIYLLVNDRLCDYPIVASPACPLSHYHVSPVPHPLPVLSVAKIPLCSADILIPFRNLFEHVGPQPPYRWDDKINAAVWRGSMPGFKTYGDTPRELLMRAAARNDTNLRGGYMTHEAQLQYKVLLDADGKTYSKRLKWFFHDGTSAVLHGGYYDDVLLQHAIPGVHYEKFQMTNESLHEKLDLLLGNDTYARLIARGGRRFGEQYIKPERWRCYMHELVRQYAAANITFVL
jgi:hypothetical protein